MTAQDERAFLEYVQEHLRVLDRTDPELPLRSALIEIGARAILRAAVAEQLRELDAVALEETP